MRRPFGTIAFAAAMLCAAPAPLQAQALRTWVSGTGNDANSCTQAAPCQTFARAFTQTAEGGEINCASNGGFGILTITRSVTIDCANVDAAILANGENGVTVNAPTARVVLRGLTIGAGQPETANRFGVNVVAVRSLALSNLVVQNFAGSGSYGVRFEPGQVSALTINDSVLINNGARSAGGGILVRSAGSGAAAVIIENVRLHRNGQVGLTVDSNAGNSGETNVAIFDSEFSVFDFGVVASTFSGGPGANVTIARSRLNGNARAALWAPTARAVIRLSDSVLSGNTLGLQSGGGGRLITYRDNVVTNNGRPGAFTDLASRQ